VRGVQFVSAFSLLPLVARASSCVEPSSESLRDSMHYIDPSADSAKQCKDCGFFTAEKESTCGQCVIMSGPVNAPAYCDSWSEKS
jgi:hypothetical protein